MAELCIFTEEGTSAQSSPSCSESAIQPSSKANTVIFFSIMRWLMASLPCIMQHDNATLVILYFSLNTAMTLWSKIVAVESPCHISFLLATAHASATWLGCVLYTGYRHPDDGRIKDVSGTPTTGQLNTSTAYQNLTLFLFALLYTINISLSNYSTSITSLSMWQSIRATGPFLTVIMIVVFEGSSNLPRELTTYLALFAIVTGVMFSVHGERWDATPAKLVWTFAGALAAVLKSYIQHRLPKFGLRLPPIDLLRAILPFAMVQALAGAYLTGEIVSLMTSKSLSWRFTALFASSAALAFCLNIVSFRAFGRVAPMSIAVAANLKQVVMLFLPFHQKPVTKQVIFGTLVTVAGTAWYSGLQKGKSQDEKINSEKDIHGVQGKSMRGSSEC